MMAKMHRTSWPQKGMISVFRLPSAGRGIEGEVWACFVCNAFRREFDVITPHPGPLPVEGRGRTRFHHALLRGVGRNSK